MAGPILNPPPSWGPKVARTITLYHGCTNDDRIRIEKGVDVRAGRLDSDFGQVAMLDADQVSFHTDTAARVLDSLIASASGYRHYVVV